MRGNFGAAVKGTGGRGREGTVYKVENTMMLWQIRGLTTVPGIIGMKKT